MNQAEIKNFEDIKEKIELLKNKKARAEGAMEEIVQGWQQNHKISTVEEAEALVAAMEKELQEDEERLDAYYKELKEVTSWNLV